MPKEFYVYVHKRNDTGMPFYVGKGHAKRAGSKHSRSDRWRYIVDKHGFTYEIVKDGMSECCAFSYERIVIHKLRCMGNDIINVTDGGGGIRGAKLKSRKPVACSNGMEFESVDIAASWANISASKISSVCNGKRKTAGGFSWWFKGSDEIEYSCPRERISRSRAKPLECSNGMSFDSALHAIDWLSDMGIKADRANISMAANGKINSAYGFAWWFTGDEKKEYKSRSQLMSKSIGIPVVRSDGLYFDCAQSASRHMRNEGFLKADGYPISLCCKGKQGKAYGYNWTYA